MQANRCRAVDIGVLLRLAGLDVLDCNPMARSPYQQLFADVFWAVIDPNGGRLAAPFDDAVNLNQVIAQLPLKILHIFRFGDLWIKGFPRIEVTDTKVQCAALHWRLRTQRLT
jgi:hypothetical protein